ncbi:allantoate amidohydrolase [Cutibacterium acnes HL001PA1]|nr:allantoate amidohydrolase [Cutibacterium acnes HL001PA1]
MTTWTAASLLAEIAAIGRNEDGSYSRFCLRPEEVALREWFVAKATELGLAIVTDGTLTSGRGGELRVPTPS